MELPSNWDTMSVDEQRAWYNRQIRGLEGDELAAKKAALAENLTPLEQQFMRYGGAAQSYIQGDRTIWGVSHADLYAADPALYHIPQNDSSWSAFDKSRSFPLGEWIKSMPVNDRAGAYIEIASAAVAFPDMLTPYEWGLLNVAQHDVEARDIVTYLMHQGVVAPGTRQDTWEDLYGDDAMKNNRSYVLGQYGEDSAEYERFDRGMEWGQLNSFIEAQPFKTVSNYAGYLGTALIAYEALRSGRTSFGAAPQSSQLAQPIPPGSTLQSFFRSPVGARLGNLVTNAARTLPADRTLRQKLAMGVVRQTPRTASGSFVKTTAAIGGVSTTGHYFLDMLALMRDADEVQQRMDSRQFRADLERAGVRIETPGSASDAEYGVVADDGEEILIGPDGHVIPWEGAEQWLTEFNNGPQTLAQGVPDEGLLDGATTSTTTPLQQAVTAPVAPFGSDGVSGAGGIYTGDQGFTQITPEMLEQIEAGVPEAKDPYLGDLSEDYRRGGVGQEGLDEMMPWAAQNPDVINSPYVTGAPKYRVSAVEDEISSWTFADVIQFQERAVAAKLINPEATIGGQPYRPGVIDDFTRGALETAMTFANTEGGGTTYKEMMDQMEQSAMEYDEKYGENDDAIWTPSRAYFAPDYASIKQTVKQTFGRELGRDPNDWEMDLLADNLRSSDRAAYDQAMQGEQSVFDAGQRALETGEIEYPDDYTAIDPAARMAETFDKQFAPELNAKDRWADVQSKSRNLFGSFGKLAG